MAGFLDQKSRIFDIVLTQEGKRQMANGKLRLNFYSFSDVGVYYTQDTIVSGAHDATYRLSLEASDSPHDRVVLESDDAGQLTGFLTSGSQFYPTKGGQVFSGSNDSLQQRQVTSGAQFNSLSEELLKTSINNFKNLYILKSPDPIEENNTKFLMGPLTSSFSLTSENTALNNKFQTVDVQDTEQFFFDKRLSHVKNYQFLPPKNKKRVGEDQGTSLGDYQNLNQENILTINQLKEELREVERSGFKETISFFETTERNNVLGQLFEFGDNKLTKLDLVDFGSFPSEFGESHVYFAGKVFVDDLGRYKYLNLFTLIFED